MAGSALSSSLGALAIWRRALDEQVASFGREAASHDLLGNRDQVLLSALRERLAAEKLVLAFVAEFSRGKSELINAILFADTGRRILPASPGRTTMCPVEMRYEIGRAPGLSLLPIETRLQGQSLADLRPLQDRWTHVPLDTDNADALAQALTAVTCTRRVTVQQAAALGFWDDSQSEDNPHQHEDGTVEVPAWRHAVINYPHPLLQRGLVIIDTPGLNAMGAEPELTLGLLPSAHAVVFVLAADMGVSRSDWSMWRDHLDHKGLERFVVLNKIDTLADPLLHDKAVQAQIEQQRQNVARTLGMPLERVFPVSARQALAARLDKRPAFLDTSRLLPLERAVAAQLMPRRQAMLLQSTERAFSQLRLSAMRRGADRRRQFAEQLLELRGLRGKSGLKLRLLLQRVDADLADFERSSARLAAVRAVHKRHSAVMLSHLSMDILREELKKMQAAMDARLFNRGARSAFADLVLRLQEALQRAEGAAQELQRMLDGSFQQLNADFGFAFVLGPPPSIAVFQDELRLIENNYGKYLGMTQAWRKAAPGFTEQFRSMLQSKLRVLLEDAAGEFDLWSRGAQSQVDVQVRERRHGFARRREALQRIEVAAGDLEQRIEQVLVQEEQLATGLARIDALIDKTLTLARAGPQADAERVAVVESPHRNLAA